MANMLNRNSLQGPSKPSRRDHRNGAWRARLGRVDGTLSGRCEARARAVVACALGSVTHLLRTRTNSSARTHRPTSTPLAHSTSCTLHTLRQDHHFSLLLCCVLMRSR